MASPWDIVEETPLQAAADPWAIAEEKPVGFGERMLGSRTGRLGLGLASAVTGPFQLGANLGDKAADALFGEGGFRLGKWTNEKLAEIEAMKKRGMAANGDGEFDAMGLGGAMLAGGVASKGVKVAATLPGKILQGGGIGALFGLSAPVTSGDEGYWGEKGTQTAVGGALGAAAPAVTAAVGSTVKGVGHLTDRFTKSGARRIADREWAQHVGSDQSRQALINALQNPKRLVRGSKPTAADVVAEMPEGLPIASVQDDISRLTIAPKGVDSPATRFKARANYRESRRDIAKIARNTMGDRMRNDAFRAATGNANSGAIIQDISRMAQNPDAPPPTQEALAKWAAIIDDVTTNGQADPRRLYGIRKMINSVLTKSYRGPDDTIKNFTGKELIQIRNLIDDSIDQVTAGKWRPYLSEFAKRSKAIDSDVARSKLATDVTRGLKAPGDTITDQAGSGLPGLLERNVAIANALLRNVSKSARPRVAAEMASDALDPKLLAAALERAAPSQKQAVITEFANKYGRGAVQNALAVQLGKE